MNITAVLQQLVSGISFGMLLFIVSSGLTLLFGVTRIINFAHGSFFMVAAYFAWSITHKLNFISAMIVVPIVLAFIGGGIEILLFKRIYKREHLVQLLLTYALIFIFADFTKVVWGVMPKSLSIPRVFEGAISSFGVVVPKYHIFVFIFGSIIFTGLWFFLNRTKVGKYIRAATEDSEMTGALGINIDRLFTVVFMIGTWLAAMSGVISTPLITILLGIDIDIIIQCFVVIIIGGMGSIAGALLGALSIGMINSFGYSILPRFIIVLMYIFLAIVLIVRPRGFLGKLEQ